jgi:hypothetical protein
VRETCSLRLYVRYEKTDGYRPAYLYRKTGKDAWVLHTIHRKENSCPTQTQIVIMAEETKNQYYVRQ